MSLEIMVKTEEVADRMVELISIIRVNANKVAVCSKKSM